MSAPHSNWTIIGQLQAKIYRIKASEAAAHAEVARLRMQLHQIAHDPSISVYDGNPLKWPSNVAYLALGGRILDGRRLDALPPPDDEEAREIVRAMARGPGDDGGRDG